MTQLTNRPHRPNSVNEGLFRYHLLSNSFLVQFSPPTHCHCATSTPEFCSQCNHIWKRSLLHLERAESSNCKWQWEKLFPSVFLRNSSQFILGLGNRSMSIVIWFSQSANDFRCQAARRQRHWQIKPWRFFEGDAKDKKQFKLFFSVQRIKRSQRLSRLLRKDDR